MNYYASGKLLIFGEYLVLNGAKCLAIPLRFGQHLLVQNSEREDILWESWAEGEIWFSATFSENLKIKTMGDIGTSQLVSHLLRWIRSEKPHLFSKGLTFVVDADFPLKWGLGSSATLISLLAQWSGVDPFSLLEISLNGSGYDVACATQDNPIVFRRKDKETIPVSLPSEIVNKVLFVYSGKKQNTSFEVLRFQNVEISDEEIVTMNTIVESALKATSIEEWESLIEESETLLSGILEMAPIQQIEFSDYPYRIKSLGAWGGDFYMATFRDEQKARDYFISKGYTTLFNYEEIIKK